MTSRPAVDIEGRILALFSGSWNRAGATEADVEALLRRAEPAGVTSTVPLSVLRDDFLASAIPEEPGRLTEYLDFLADHVLPHTIHTAAPEFIGHMNVPMPNFTAPLSEILAVLNQNVVKVETSRVLTLLERETLSMLHRLVYARDESFYEAHGQNRESTLGIMLSGGTLANVTALWCARNERLGGTPGAAGTAGVLRNLADQESVVIGSEMMHYSFDKALDLLGLGTDNLIRVPVRADHTLDPQALRAAGEELRRAGRRILAVIGIAGTTDSGAVDPLGELAQVARGWGSHFHVDACWGGPMLFTDDGRRLLAGIEEADTIAIDGHKQFYLPMGIGTVLFREPSLARVIERQAAYIIRAQSEDLGRRSLEGSRPAVSFYLHAALHLIGRRGYEFLMLHALRMAGRFAELIRSRAEFQLLLEPAMNILLYRFIPPELRAKADANALAESEHRRINGLNSAIQTAQFERGRTFVSRTTVPLIGGGGERRSTIALRAILANPLTREEHLVEVLDEQCAIYDTFLHASDGPGPLSGAD